MSHKDPLTDRERAFVKLYSNDELKLMKNLSVEQLQRIVSEEKANLESAKVDMESTTEYKKAQDVLQNLRAGYNSLKKLLDAKMMVALELQSKQGAVKTFEKDPDKGR